MGFMDEMKQLAKKDLKTIVLPEGEEERNLIAAGKINDSALANLVLIGNEEKIRAKAKELNSNIEGLKIVDPETYEKTAEYAKELYEIRKKKGMTEEKAAVIIKDPLYFATVMLKLGHVDGMVSGAIHTTGDLLRPGLQIVKTKPGIKAVSGVVMLEVPNCEYGKNGLVLVADAAVNPNPNAEELASIAIATAETARDLCGMDPKVAMLSFSTKGSAEHELVDKVRRATEIAQEQRPDLDIDGELQLDAALVQSVADLKAPGSKVAGKANVLVLPDLQSGNIAYKLIQRFAKAEATGPICQGFAKPINDLSRGCSADDIVNVVTITAIQAQNN
ncbi:MULTISPECIES: phosphate acetyltransferase [Clostridium]|uniref:Phosphate acetyltransferase n=2 Tax=Clostridium novyi TaxID=1542 RepID=A0Q0Z6_CLONN|nr:MULTISPECIES: phosphate acetyltransferase [Clostridium]ABK62074.1 phosphate acetyltransferase [Clostridium novyi NT]KEH88662.1 phosphate acetyltransferase [Clostridium novyi A str. NCTC 538]KEH89595.1 phosphate acetyltransferase [Clostridium novyi A str. 4540]KEH89648.1 phosphate acetyltransferase [Clostridium novyi A str. BKT29909]KEH94518.1 phosphate acetyltransferase [Clostridium botulinum C/D str. It1]